MTPAVSSYLSGEINSGLHHFSPPALVFDRPANTESVSTSELGVWARCIVSALSFERPARSEYRGGVQQLRPRFALRAGGSSLALGACGADQTGLKPFVQIASPIAYCPAQLAIRWTFACQAEAFNRWFSKTDILSRLGGCQNIRFHSSTSPVIGSAAQILKENARFLPILRAPPFEEATSSAPGLVARHVLPETYCL